MKSMRAMAQKIFSLPILKTLTWIGKRLNIIFHIRIDVNNRNCFRFLIENFEKALDMVEKIKSSGNHFFKIEKYTRAGRKYQKALKYINALRDAMGTTR